MSDEKLTPMADLNEALARGQQPRKLWPLLSHVEHVTNPPDSSAWSVIWIVSWVGVLAVGALCQC